MGGGRGSGTGDKGGSGGKPGSGTGGDQPTCTDTPLTLNDAGGFAPGGPTPGSWYSVTCVYPGPAGAMTTRTEWIPNVNAAPAAPGVVAVAAVDPQTLAVQAERSIQLPSPVLHTDPSAEAVVNLLTWLWIDPAVWVPVSVTASAGSVSATAVATPVSVAWSMGDGATVSCLGPGTPFDTAVSADDQSTGCSYSYPVSSAGQPAPDGDPDHAAFPVTATITWSVSWTSQGAVGGGELPDLTTDATVRLPVEQVESVNADLSSLPVRPPSGPRSDRSDRHLGARTDTPSAPPREELQ